MGYITHYTAEQLKKLNQSNCDDADVLADAALISHVCYRKARLGEKSCTSIVSDRVIVRKQDVMAILRAWGFKVTEPWFCGYSTIKISWD